MLADHEATGANLPKTEIQPADDLLLLAAQVQVQIWSLTSGSRALSSWSQR